MDGIVGGCEQNLVDKCCILETNASQIRSKTFTWVLQAKQSQAKPSHFLQ
jgi:hypothetical protein